MTEDLELSRWQQSGREWLRHHFGEWRQKAGLEVLLIIQKKKWQTQGTDIRKTSEVIIVKQPMWL